MSFLTLEASLSYVAPRALPSCLTLKSVLVVGDVGDVLIVVDARVVLVVVDVGDVLVVIDARGVLVVRYA